MKLLLDQNLSAELVRLLHETFPEITHVKLAGLLNANDRTLWRWAKAKGYTICSKDGDFYSWVVAEKTPKLVWLQIGNMSVHESARVLRENADLIKSFEHDSDQAVLILKPRR